jgi:hypothetical protein
MHFTTPVPARALRPTRLCHALPLLLALGLAGCAGEPPVATPDSSAPAQGAATDPTDVLTGKAPIRRMTGRDPTYPNLSGVPARPAAASSPAERQALLDRLQADRSASEAKGEALRARPAPENSLRPVVPDAPPAPPAERPATQP